jgi:uncharacterized membrane protein
VFDFVVSEWQDKMSFFEGIYDWRRLTEQRMSDGFQIAYKAKILGVESEIEMKVSNFVENEGWIATSTKGPQCKGKWSFARVNGNTRFTYTLEYKLPIPIVGGIMDALLVKRSWEKIIDKSLRNLKEHLETQG